MGPRWPEWVEQQRRWAGSRPIAAAVFAITGLHGRLHAAGPLYVVAHRGELTELLDLTEAFTAELRKLLEQEQPMTDPSDDDIYPLGPPSADALIRAHRMGVSADRVPDELAGVALLRAGLLADLGDPGAADLAVGAILSTTDCPLLVPILAGLCHQLGRRLFGSLEEFDRQLANWQAGGEIDWPGGP